MYQSHNVVFVAMASTDLTMEEKTEDGDTALTLAAEAGLVENVNMLLQHSASPHNTNSKNETPLLIGNTQTHIQTQHITNTLSVAASLTTTYLINFIGSL